LAASASVTFKTADRSLIAGDRLVLFSDGLPEATNCNGEFFGDAEIERAIRENSENDARGLVRGIFDKVIQFEGGTPRYDDIACISMIYHGPQRVAFDLATGANAISNLENG
jgi:sigma-B regulation protein RsbU (phosphoserine phosphatase)